VSVLDFFIYFNLGSKGAVERWGTETRMFPLIFCSKSSCHFDTSDI